MDVRILLVKANTDSLEQKGRPEARGLGGVGPGPQGREVQQACLESPFLI